MTTRQNNEEELLALVDSIQQYQDEEEKAESESADHNAQPSSSSSSAPSSSSSSSSASSSSPPSLYRQILKLRDNPINPEYFHPQFSVGAQTLLQRRIDAMESLMQSSSAPLTSTAASTGAASSSASVSSSSSASTATLSAKIDELRSIRASLASNPYDFAVMEQLAAHFDFPDELVSDTDLQQARKAMSD